jgi:hypothetical protein
MLAQTIVQCPHCKDFVWIEQLNCRIFRHACYKNGVPIPPHASKEECESLLEKQLVYGCTKPFQILLDGSVVECDYI